MCRPVRAPLGCSSKSATASESKMPAYYPVFLDVRERRCVVFGGGDIGEEKAARLMEFGARTFVISPEINEGLKDELDGARLTWIRRSYQPGDLDGAFIAIVADTSDGKMNRAISQEAKERNVPLNVADVTHLCTWIAPAIVQRGDVIVAASTGGASPALARKLREELSGSSPMGSRHGVMDFADLAPLLSDVRKELLRRGIRLNPDHWQACLTDDLVDLVQAGSVDEARDALMSSLLVGAECECEDGTCRMWEDLRSESAPMPDSGGSITIRQA